MTERAAISPAVRSPRRRSRSWIPSDALRFALVGEMLQLELRLRQRVAIEQLAQLGLAEQLAELGLVDGQRLRAALRERGVAVVQEVRDVAEEHRGRERRRLDGVGRVDADRALADLLRQLDERGDVEDVAQAFAIGLENDRERAEARRNLQQVVRALALLPERRASRIVYEAGAGRGRRPRGTSRRTWSSRRAAAAGAARPRPDRAARAPTGGGLSVSGKRTMKPSSLHIDSTSMASSLRTLAVTAIAHGAWILPPNGESTQTRQSPSSSDDALDDDRAVVRHRAGRFLLIAKVLEEVLGRAFVEVVLLRQAADGLGALRLADLAHQLSDGLAERYRALRGVGLPERHLPRLPRRGRDDHFVMGDLFDPPRRGAEDEGLAGERLRRPSPRRARRRARTGSSPSRRGRRRTGRGRGSCRRW